MSFVKPVQFYQDSEPWANRLYTTHSDPNPTQTMARTGNAPTIAADVVATLKDPDVDPWELAELSIRDHHRTRMNGTAWAFFKDVAGRYGFHRFVESDLFARMVECLDAGGLVVCCMNHDSFWMPYGGYVLAWQHDNAFVHCLTSIKTSKEKQPVEDFKKECRRYFCFYPDDYDDGNE